MKYIRYIFIFTCLLFVGVSSVDAARSTCSGTTKKELATAANHIKISYEIKDYSEEKELVVDNNRTTYKVPNYVFEYSIYNITEDIYVQIDSTDGNQRTKSVYYRDTVEGTYTFTDENFGEIYNYNFVVKSANSECPGTTLRTIKQTKPRYNAYSEYTYCSNSSNYYCQRFIGTEISVKGTDDFLNKIKVNNELNNPDRADKEDRATFWQLLKDNWKTYTLIFFGVAVVVVAIIVFIKYRSKKKGWKL